MANSVYIKQHIFPSEILGLGKCALIPLRLCCQQPDSHDFLFLHSGHVPGYTVIYVPLMLVPLILWTLGVVWIVSAISSLLSGSGSDRTATNDCSVFFEPYFLPRESSPGEPETVLRLKPLCGDFRNSEE